jgi:hypothetical protein
MTSNKTQNKFDYFHLIAKVSFHSYTQTRYQHASQTAPKPPVKYSTMRISTFSKFALIGLATLVEYSSRLPQGPGTLDGCSSSKNGRRVFTEPSIASRKYCRRLISSLLRRLSYYSKQSSIGEARYLRQLPRYWWSRQNVRTVSRGISKRLVKTVKVIGTREP